MFFYGSRVNVPQVEVWVHTGEDKFLQLYSSSLMATFATGEDVRFLVEQGLTTVLPCYFAPPLVAPSH